VPRWRAIVFDLDDTLYPEREYVLSGFRAVAHWAAAHLAIPFEVGYAELKLLFEQGVRGDTFNRWLAMHQLPPDHWVPQLVRSYREHTPVLAPFSGVPELLGSLCQRYRLGLLSDGYLAVQQRKLAALGLERHFDAIVFSDEWGRAAWKPSVKPFQELLECLQLNAFSALYVADNPLKDFLGARQVGMFTIRIQWPGGEYAKCHPPTAQHAPDLTIESLDDLPQALIQVEKQC
jgi:putative hydrolase of the HAD superfamily